MRYGCYMQRNGLLPREPPAEAEKREVFPTPDEAAAQSTAKLMRIPNTQK